MMVQGVMTSRVFWGMWLTDVWQLHGRSVVVGNKFVIDVIIVIRLSYRKWLNPSILLRSIIIVPVYYSIVYVCFTVSMVRLSPQWSPNISIVLFGCGQFSVCSTPCTERKSKRLFAVGT